MHKGCSIFFLNDPEVYTLLSRGGGGSSAQRFINISTAKSIILENSGIYVEFSHYCMVSYYIILNYYTMVRYYIKVKYYTKVYYYTMI